MSIRNPLQRLVERCALTPEEVQRIPGDVCIKLQRGEPAGIVLVLPPENAKILADFIATILENNKDALTRTEKDRQFYSVVWCIVAALDAMIVIREERL